MAVQSLIELQTVTLAPGATSAPVAHTLHNSHGSALTPNWIYPVKLTSVRPLSFDSTEVVYINDGPTSQTVTFCVKYDHSIQRSSQQGAAGLQFIYAGAGDLVNSFSNDPALNLNVYLDGINGLDSNDGLAPVNAPGGVGPLQTYGAYYNKFPRTITGGAKVLLSIAGDGGFSSPTAPLTYTDFTFILPGPGTMFRNGFAIRAAPKCPAAPATGTTAPVVASLEEINQLNALAPGTGYRTRFNCTAPGWTANDLRNQRIFVRVQRAGVNVIPETPVAENDANSFTIDIPCAVEVLPTDTTTLVRCSVQFTGPISELTAFMITGGGSEEVWSDEAMTGNGNTIQGVEFVGAPNFVNFIGGVDGCASSGINIHFVGCQMTMMQCAWGLTAFYHTVVNRFQGNPGWVSAVNPIYQTSPYRMTFQAVGTMSVGDQFGAPAWVGCHDCLSHYNGSSLRVYGPGSLLSMLGSSSARLMGSGSTGSGLWARYGGKIIVQVYPRTQIVGALGALRVGAFPTIVNYGTGVGQFEEVAGYNGNLYWMDGSVPAAPLGDDSQIRIGG